MNDYKYGMFISSYRNVINIISYVNYNNTLLLLVISKRQIDNDEIHSYKDII